MNKATLMFLALVPATLQAATWNHALEAGYSRSSGNSNVESLFFSAKTQYEAERYGAEAAGKLDKQATDGKLTKAYYLIQAKAKHYFSHQRSSYLFAAAQWEQDEPNGQLDSWSLTGGPGYQWHLPQKQTLSIEAGAGYQHSDYTDDSRDYEGVVARLFAAYTYPVNDAVTFQADTLSFFDQERHLNTTNLKVESTLAQHLSLGAGFEYRYNSKPDLGKKSEDTTLRLTLKYAF